MFAAGIYGQIPTRHRRVAVPAAPMPPDLAPGGSGAGVGRLIDALRRRCLDHVIVFSEGHARRLLSEFAAYYNTGRSHSALDGDAPEPRERSSPGSGRVVAAPVLGGLHHTYRRAV